MNAHDFQVLFKLIFVFALMIFVWKNWLLLDKKGNYLSNDVRPGFFRFWLVVVPSFAIGMKYGVEISDEEILQIKARKNLTNQPEEIGE